MSAKNSKPSSLERVRYYPRQLMTAEDMSAEQNYFVERMRRHNRLFHGWGILCGLEVQPAATADKPWQVRVCPGDACCPPGDEVHVAAPVLFDLARAPGLEDNDCIPCPCPPEPPMRSAASDAQVHYLAIRYACRPVRPVRTSQADCGCAENNCETSRLRDDFELALLADLPVPYDEKSRKEEEEWLGKFKATSAGASLFGMQARPCGPTSVGSWLILTTVRGDLSRPPPATPMLPTATIAGVILPPLTFATVSDAASSASPAVVSVAIVQPPAAVAPPTPPAAPPAPSPSAHPATTPTAGSTQPLSPLDASLMTTLSSEWRRLLPRAQDVLVLLRG